MELEHNLHATSNVTVAYKGLFTLNGTIFDQSDQKQGFLLACNRSDKRMDRRLFLISKMEVAVFF